MAKLALLLATSALLFLIANASIYRTTIEFDEETRGQSCEEQFQQQQQLMDCQMFLRQQSQGGESDNQRKYLRLCCKQLKKMESTCRCKGLAEAARIQQQQGPFDEEQEMYETASQIPRKCEMQPMKGCDFRPPYISL